jgi:arylformamidase
LRSIIQWSRRSFAASGVNDLAPIGDTSLNIALKLTKIATLSPLRLPIVQKQLTIAYGAAELPALVWDSKMFYDARKAAGRARRTRRHSGRRPFHHPG